MPRSRSRRWSGRSVASCMTGSSSSTSRRAGHVARRRRRKLRRVYGQRRVGHAGTLDPDATGVLLVGLGRVDAAAALPAGSGEGVPRPRRVRRRDRHARRVGRGARTRRRCRSNSAQVERAAARVRRRHRADPADGVGDQGRRPQALRARPHGRGGRARGPSRAHRRARASRSSTPGAYPEATIRVDCSSGTYVRTLAADLGAALGGCAHLGGAAPPARRVVLASTRLVRSTAIEADPDAARALARGRDARPRARSRSTRSRRARSRTAPRSRRPRCSATTTAPGPFAVVDERGVLLAVYERRGGGVKPSVVLAPQESSS